LFEPEKPAQVPEQGIKPAPMSGVEPARPAETGEKPPAKEQSSVTSRLLDAKRRAKKRTDRE
jgi:hypothetical protein